jgi:hypothetical protein
MIALHAIRKKADCFHGSNIARATFNGMRRLLYAYDVSVRVCPITAPKQLTTTYESPQY